SAGRGCLQNRRTPSPSAFDSYFKRKSGAKDVCKLTNPIAFCF
ncbi:hypothetical protein HMPREF9420_0850, partial [Segatella salivae DSM 15606]